MLSSKKLKWRRIINELEYLYDEFDIVNELVKQTGPEFEEYYKAYCAKNEVDREGLNKENKERLEDLYGPPPEKKEEACASEYSGSTSLTLTETETFEEQEIDEDDSFKDLHSEFNKLFKKLALVLHPDRIENYTSDDEYKRKLAADFNKARHSLEKKRYFELIKLAKKYNVLIPENYSIQVRWFKRDKDNIMIEIDKTKKTYNYKFSECETDDERDALIKSFISQVFRI
tara:strand:+ start:1920 stop:2609 length:690 start_codon:yes stop_codon:yes gene_type:complete